MQRKEERTFFGRQHQLIIHTQHRSSELALLVSLLILWINFDKVSKCHFFWIQISQSITWTYTFSMCFKTSVFKHMSSNSCIKFSFLCHQITSCFLLPFKFLHQSQKPRLPLSKFEINSGELYLLIHTVENGGKGRLWPRFCFKPSKNQL